MPQLAAFAALLIGCNEPPRREPPPAETVEVEVAGHLLQAELAIAPEAIERGLMFRRELSEGTGMLFAYPEAAVRVFWMRNTFLPLSIAFIDADGSIVSMADMKPFDETPHSSGLPAQYALEVGQGWFEERAIGPGARVSFALP